MKKRMFLFPLLVLLCLCAFSAGAQVVTEGNYEFEIPDGDFDPAGAATLRSYLGGNGDTLTLPLWCQGYPVTAIGNRAFLNRSELKQVVISSRVQSVGESAFEKCSGLTDVSFPEGLSVLSDRAFYGCASLTACDFPNSLREIGESCFEGCTVLASVDPPQRLQTIEKRAFYGCESLPSIRIYGKVRQVGESAFESCTALTTVQLADGVMTIGRRAFANCSALVSANLTSSLAEIGEEAFRDCKSFQGEQYATDENGEPQYQLQIYGNIGTIGKSAYEGCDALRFIVFAAGADLTICERAFANCTGLLSAGFPTSLRSIGERAFYGCKRLQAATFREDSKGGIETIGESAFDGCSILCYPARGEDGSIIYRTLALPSTLKSIGKRAFYGCGIRSLGFTVGTQGISIGESAFESNLSLTQVAIFGDNTEGDISVGTAAFRGCSNMTTLILSERITHIGVSAFQNCSKLSQLGERYAKEDGTMATRGYYLPAALRSVGANAFRGCAALTIVALHATTSSVSLGDSVFMECTSLTRAVLPSSVTVLPRNFFRGCSNMTTFTLPTRLVSIGGSALEGCSSLPSLSIPASVTSIGDSAFRNCSSLTKVDFKSGLETIGSSAFLGCTSLGTLALPDTLTSIGARAFSGLPKGSEVTILAGVTNIGQDALTANITVYGYDPSEIKTYCANNDIPFIALNDHSCGSGVRFTLVPQTGEKITYTLRVFGEGEMDNYESADKAPWINYKDCIIALSVEEGVTTVGAHALQGYENLSSITLANSVIRIGEAAFENCAALDHIDFPDSLIHIENASFHGCSSLKSITLPENLETLGDNALSSIRQTAYIVVPSSLTNIGKNVLDSSAFVYGYKGSHMQTYCNENGIKNFYEINGGVCGESASYTLTPDTKNGWITLAIHGNGSMTDYSEDNAAPWDSAKILIRSIFIDEGIVHLGAFAFKGCENLTGISIPAYVTSIGESSFANCKKLPSLTLPDGLMEIGASAFENCATFSEFSLPSTITAIPEKVFFNCSALETIAIPSSISSIGISAFEDCKGLTQLLIPENVISIADSAFKGCVKLTSITLPKGLEILGDFVFENCSALNEFVLPDGITSISNGLFKGCTKLQIIDFSENCFAIGNSSFSGCSLLADIRLPDTVEQIEENAFYDVQSKIYVPKSVTAVQENAFGQEMTVYGYTNTPTQERCISDSIRFEPLGNGICGQNAVYTLVPDFSSSPITMNLTISGEGDLYDLSEESDLQWNKQKKQISEITISEGITSLGENSFNGCSALTSFIFPDSVKTIGASCFKNCSYLTDVRLPAQLTYLRDYAFSGCTNLSNLILPDGVKEIDAYALYSIANSAKIFVPSAIEIIGNSAIQETAIVFGFRETEIETYCRNNNITFIPLNTGNCGNTLEYNLIADKETGLLTLTITGSGPMNDFTLETPAPWSDSASRISTVIIELGVTSIGDNAFSSLWNNANILIPDSVKSLGESSIAPSATVFGISDSQTETYCEENKISFFAVGEGICGEGLSYSFSVNLKTGLIAMQISGSGKMNDYENQNQVPWNREKVRISSVVLSNEVSHIGSYAFCNMPLITELIMPSSLQSIGTEAFSGCTSISSVSLPNGATSLGSFAFKGCTSLMSIRLPETLTVISKGAFQDCTTLWDISLPEGITKIENSIFENCTTLAEIKIPDSVNSISERVFYGCASLSFVSLGDSVNSIGTSAFENCKSLSALNLPGKITSIGSKAFAGTGIISLTIPNSVHQIGAEAFSSSMTITCSADSYAINYCRSNNIPLIIAGSCGDAVTYTLTPLESGNYRLTLSGTGSTNDYSQGQAPWYGERERIEELTVESGITRIGSFAIAGCTALKTVSLPNTLTQIGERAFQGSTPVYDSKNPVNVVITLPNSIEKIDGFAFRNCYTLTTFSFMPDTALTEIPEGMFEGCPRLSFVSIPDGIASIGANAFHACTALARISLPSSLKTLGSSAFDGCSVLRTMLLENTNLTTIPSRAFAECTKLQDFSFPSGLESIGDSAFSGCQQLEREMIIPESVTSIGNSAFKSCTSLYAVTLPQNLGTLGASAFSTCTGLCRIGIAGQEGNALPGGLTAIHERTFEDCTSLASLALPAELSSLGDFVFSGCSKLAAMDIPGKITTLGSSVFANCESLVRVTLPQNMTAIGTSCFRGCAALPEIDLPASLSALGSYAFQNCRQLPGITVPAGVTELPEGIFYNCTAFRTIDAPNVTSAGNSAFFGCQQLTDASFAQQFTSLGESAFENCVSLTRVVLSGNLSGIKKRTFFGCSSLSDAQIPEGIGTVGERAFCNCISLKEILFPVSLKTVEVDAFKGCTSLSAVTIPEGNNAVTLRSGAFSGLPKNARVYLPRNLAPVIATDVFTSGTVIWGHRFDSDGTSNSTAWNCAKNHNLKFTNVDGDAYSAAMSVSDMTVGLGITRDAEVSVFPLGTEYTLSSSDPSVVAVEGKKLRGVSLGSANLTVVCNGSSKTAKVTVAQAASDFTVPDLVLVRNSTGQISPVVSPAGAAAEFSYTRYGATADAGGSIVTVNRKGKVTAIELGEASVLVTDAVSGISKPCHITVAYGADSIVFSPPVQTLFLGIPEPVNLWVDIRDTRMRNVFSTFASEDPAIASISPDGVVTPHAVGQTTITAKSGSKLSAKMTLLVTTGQTLPASATTVRNGAFAGTAFVRLVVPEGYTSIGSRAFADNRALRYLALPDSLRAGGIPADMLEGCDKKKLTIVCASENSDAAKWAADNGFTVLVP